MKRLDVPFNIDLLRMTPFLMAGMKPVTSLDIVETINGNLSENGLFSVSIFGRMNDEERDRRFSYVDIRTTILHPIIFKRLERLKGLYREILSGRAYAAWDNTLKDFVKASELDGDTGYQFFMSHWNDLQFRENTSAIRGQNIELLNKYRNRALVDKILIMPAGLRDIEIDSNGQTRWGEINDIYRRIIAISRTVADTDEKSTSPVLNNARWMLQQAFVDVFDFLENMLQGKKGFLQGRWGSRRIFNGTRNVISTMNTSVKKLGGRNAPRFTDTILGLHQLSRALLPVTIHVMRSGYLSHIFNVGESKAHLVDKQTLHSEIVSLPHDVYDRYTSVEGVEKLIASYGQIELRNRPIEIEDRYLALIYVDDKSNFRVFYDIDELPEGFDRKWVRPINLCELLYLSGYRHWNEYAGFVARYPITGIGSCYPTTVYVKTTIVGEMRYELDHNWQRFGEDHLALEFPVYDPLTYLDSQVIPSARLAGLGAD